LFCVLILSTFHFISPLCMPWSCIVPFHSNCFFRIDFTVFCTELTYSHNCNYFAFILNLCVVLRIRSIIIFTSSVTLYVHFILSGRRWALYSTQHRTPSWSVSHIPSFVSICFRRSQLLLFYFYFIINKNFDTNKIIWVTVFGLLEKLRERTHYPGIFLLYLTDATLEWNQKFPECEAKSEENAVIMFLTRVPTINVLRDVLWSV
jgi:hypothetical protein